MAGYVSPQLESQALADLLRLLERQLPTLVGASEYRAFGANIGDPIRPGDLSSFAAPAAYECGACDNQESHIDTVLERIARSPADAIDLVVTDMWLDNRSFHGSDEVALGEPLRDILRSGRAVGIIGIQAPFDGTVYDVPGVGDYRGAKQRPLFLVMVGRPEKLEKIFQVINQSRSPTLASNLKFSLYSTAALEPAPGPQIEVRGRGVSRIEGPRGGGLRDQRQLRLTLSHAERGEGALVAAFQLKPELENRVWKGEPIQRTRVWRLKSDAALEQCASDTWDELPALPSTWQATRDPSVFSFSLDHRVETRLPAPGTYYVVAEVGVVGLTLPTSQSNWMDQWSLQPDDAAAFVRGRPAVFKALKLGRLRTILDDEIGRQLAGKTRMVRRTAFLLRLER